MVMAMVVIVMLMRMGVLQQEQEGQQEGDIDPRRRIRGIYPYIYYPSYHTHRPYFFSFLFLKIGPQPVIESEANLTFLGWKNKKGVNIVTRFSRRSNHKTTHR